MLLAALLGGGLAGLILGGMQHIAVVPMILEAETYETGGDEESEAAPGDEAEVEPWAPEDGAERTFWTVLNSMLVGIGFGLLLSACYALRGRVTWQGGILWGLAGFAVFNLAPSLGLPPELPGDAAAGLEQRQVWWVLTAAVTAAGLWIIAFQPKPYLKLFGVALLVLPHVFGAPHPDVHGGLVPDELRTSFAIATMLTNAVFWVLLGVFTALLYSHFGGGAEDPASA
ncbi:MAG: CbtA family protein [Proteobacteria bacterium]|nr:CbtA family protein [Pseudomonadota bacterium]